MAAATGGYTFAQQPRAVQNNRTKYRPQNYDETNIMWDKRVVRGNTYAAELILPSTEDGMSRPQSEQGSTRLSRLRARERAKRHRQRLFGTRTKQEMDPTPSHEYLEELAEPTVKASSHVDLGDDDNAEVDSVQFVPKPSGNDVQTWVSTTDLFDFDMSVESILARLVGKSMDQGMTEVLQEEQMKMRERHRVRVEQERSATFAEAQRLESELQRGKEEIVRRLEQEKTQADDLSAETKAQNAKDLAKEYYSELQERVLTRLGLAGHFYDPVLSQVESSFLPWLVDKVARQLQNIKSMRENTNVCLSGAVDRGVKEIEAKQEQDRVAAEAEAERLRLEEEERQRVEKELEEQRIREDVAARLAAETAALETGDNEGDEGEEEES